MFLSLSDSLSLRLFLRFLSPNKQYWKNNKKEHNQNAQYLEITESTISKRAFLLGSCVNPRRTSRSLRSSRGSVNTSRSSSRTTIQSNNLTLPRGASLNINGNSSFARDTRPNNRRINVDENCKRIYNH